MNKNFLTTLLSMGLKLLSIFFLILFISVLTLFAYLLIKEKSLSEPSQPPEVIIILGAQVKQDGTPSLQLKYRLETALALQKEYPDSYIITSGAQGSDEPAPEAYIMRDWLIDHGVNSEQIYCDPNSFNTKQNLKNAYALILEHLGPEKVVYIITSDYHLPRALAIADDIGINAFGLPSPTSKEYWFKNRFRETLSWGKYFLEKQLDKE